MRARVVVLSALACAALTLGAAWLFELSLERAILLAPALVIGAGLLAAVGLLLGRAALQSIRESGHPRLVVGALVGLVVLGAVLTVLGVELPRE